ncbi:MAG: hypothetical protein FJ313_08615 [Gemmatimonadetes bacterium]|nr:hypothetical protein [Gemmatimonadota bacterium]
MMDRKRARQVVFWVIAADFPFMYAAAVPLANEAMTLAGLAVMGAAALAAALVY